jgi:hypothetical protein
MEIKQHTVFDARFWNNPDVVQGDAVYKPKGPCKKCGVVKIVKIEAVNSNLENLVIGKAQSAATMVVYRHHLGQKQ